MDHLTRTVQALEAHALSLPEHFLLCSAGYRVTFPPEAFVEHTFAVALGDRRGSVTRSELTAALEHLEMRGLLTRLTEADLVEEARRRTIAIIPEVFDVGYDVGHVDFTPLGYTIHRDVVRAIYGDDHLARGDAGFNLDPTAGRFDVYALTRERCRALMDEIEAGGEDYTGIEPTRFVGRVGPRAIAHWRPNRFVTHATGYHGALHFRGDG
jgi:hypothetical protein